MSRVNTSNVTPGKLRKRIVLSASAYLSSGSLRSLWGRRGAVTGADLHRRSTIAKHRRSIGYCKVLLRRPLQSNFRREDARGFANDLSGVLPGHHRENSSLGALLVCHVHYPERILLQVCHCRTQDVRGHIRPSDPHLAEHLARVRRCTIVCVGLSSVGHQAV